MDFFFLANTIRDNCLLCMVDLSKLNVNFKKIVSGVVAPLKEIYICITSVNMKHGVNKLIS